MNGTIAVLSKVTKALDENIFETMTSDWVAEEMREFLQSAQFNSEDKLIGLESMSYWYKYSRSIENGVLTVEITADPK